MNSFFSTARVCKKIKINRSYKYFLFVTFLVVIFSYVQASAATITWTGGGDGSSWSDDDNWSSATRPDPNNNTDDIAIDCSCAVDFDEGEALDILGTLTIASGTTLDLNNEDFFVGDASNPNATLTNDGTITNVKKLENGGNASGLGNGPYVINTGTINADNLRIGTIPEGGYFTNTSAGTVNVDNGIHLDGTLCNQGLMNLGGEFFNHGGFVDCCGNIETPDVKVDDNTNRKGTFLCIDICNAGSDPGFTVSNDNVDSLWVDDIPKYNNVISTDENDTYICGINRNGVTGPPAPEYPGGVIPNLSMWLKADQGTDSPVDGDNVSIWSDRSASGNFVQQLTVGNQPTYRDNTTDNINFNPVVYFDGNNDVMSDISGILRAATHTDINVYSVVVTDQVKNAFLFKEATTDNRISVTTPWGDNNYYWDAGNAGGSDNRLTANWGGTTGTPYLWSNLYSTTLSQTVTGDRQVIERNGLSIGNDATAPSFTGNNSTFNLGSDGSNDYNGKIAEFIVYLGPIDATQHNQIESYLAIKYGITLDNSAGGTNGDYMASDGTTLLWDADANTGTYHNDVAGIGRDDLTGLDQQHSISINSDAIVTMNKGSAFSNDKDYILWGNDNGAIATTTTGANPVFDSRLERTWISSITGTPGNVTVTIDFANDGIESHYGLHVDSDGDFTTGATTYLASSFSGNSIIFENVNFSNGDFFTLGIRQVAPGNVSNNLALWLKSDIGTNTTTDGDRISNWNDQSTSSNDVAQVISGKQPLLRSNATDNINYYPMVDFDGNNDLLSDATGILGSATHTDINVYSVVVTDQVKDAFLFKEVTTDNRISATTPWGDNNYYWDAGNAGGSDNRLTANWGGTTGTPYLWSSLYSTTLSQTVTGDRQVIERNGLSIGNDATAPSFTGNNSTFRLGSDGSNDYNGKIAEFIIYLGPITAAEHNQIENYLAIKYSITLDNSGGGTDGDYVASDGTTIWDADSPAGYQNEIISIGRDDKSSLYQKQSHHQHDSLRLFIDALAADNASNGGTIANDISFITIGHNGAKQRAQNVEMPPGVVSRFGREWKVTNTNFDDDFSLEVEWDDIDAGGFDITMIRLLVDTDDDFSDATVLSTVDGLTFTEGSIIVGSIGTGHIPKNSTAFITIASVNWGVPLPIELISFDASVTDKGTVELSWQTASEINNDFFTIERSKDDQEWKEVSIIDGAGNSAEKLSYSFEDTRPYSGISYYRLKQTDFDGQFTYSDIKVVTLNGLEENEIHIYPNPGNELMTIEGNKVGLASFALFDIYGHNVTKSLQITDQNLRSITIDISKLADGFYTLKTKNHTRKIIKH